MTTDSPIRSWIEGRRVFVQESKLRRWGDGDIRRITSAIEKVLELHGPVETGVSDQYWKEPDYCPTCSEYWPCATVRAIEGAINHE